MLFGVVGGYGSGKTVMAAALLQETCKRLYREPKYATASRLFRDLHKSRCEGEGEQAVINRYGRASLLVLDEADKRAGTEYEDRLLCEIVDLRYKRGRDTVLISNLSAERFAASVGGAVMDRIRQCGELIECDWSSFRAGAAGSTCEARQA